MSHYQVPDFLAWRDWSEEDYRSYFLSKRAAKVRLREREWCLSSFTEEEIWQFCAPIRAAIKRTQAHEAPELSIVLRAYNEERELLPTLVGFALATVVPTTTELIVCDNNSTDQTSTLIEACGAKRVFCEKPGIGFATEAGYHSISSSTKFVLISDADVRPVKPSFSRIQPATFLKTSYDYLQANPRAMGVSTGTVVETAHWLYLLVRWLSTNIRGKNRESYWAGANQFIRREALDAVGGIDPHVEYGFGEDHARRYQLTRWCKPRGLLLPEGLHDEKLVDPNYHSGRRYASALMVVRHWAYLLKRRRPDVGADGLPEFERGKEIRKESIR